MSKSEAPHPQRFTPIEIARRRFIAEARTRRDSSSVSRGNLLKRQKAPHPQGLLPPPVPPAAGGGKLHARRGSPWMRLLSGAKRGEPRPAGDSPTASPRSLKGVPEAPHPRDSPHFFCRPRGSSCRKSRTHGIPASSVILQARRCAGNPAPAGFLPFPGKARGCFPSGNRGGRGIAPAVGKG